MRAFKASYAGMQGAGSAAAIPMHLVSSGRDVSERIMTRRPPQTLGSTSRSRCSRRRRSAARILWRQTTCDASARLATRAGSRGRCRDLNAPPPHRGSVPSTLLQNTHRNRTEHPVLFHLFHKTLDAHFTRRANTRCVQVQLKMWQKSTSEFGTYCTPPQLPKSARMQ
jgi:hypothetical protein